MSRPTPQTRHDVPARKRSARRPALDGIRALSVIAVMIYHANAKWIPGGFLSVNAFFVLSGYLITGLCLKEASRSGRIDLVGFYKNRARRLLPALFIVIVAVTLVGARILTSNARGHLRGDALATLFYVANWRFISEGESYFSSSGDPSPFRHMWTLAIEEQFYLIFPVLLIGLIILMKGRRRRITQGFVVLIAASALVQGWIYLHQIKPMADPDPSRIYYGTDTRANELLLGAALAVAMTYWRQRTLRANASRLTMLGIASFVGMLAFFFGPNETSSWVFLGGSVLFSVLICCIIVAIEVEPHSGFAKVLSWKPIVWIGELSYGIYLWHWPIFVFLNHDRTGLADPVLLIVRLALSLALATVSYYWIEQPIRTKKLQTRLGPQRAITAWCVSVPIVLAVVLFSTQGIKTMTDGKSGTAVSTQVGSGDKRILIIGDSVAYALAFHFPAAQYPGVSLAGSAKIGCGTATQWLVVNGVPQKEGNPECDDQVQAWKDAVAQDKPQVVLWSMGGWDVYDHVIDGKSVGEMTPAYASYYRGRLEAGLEAIGRDTQLVIPKAACYDQPSYVVEGQDLAPNRNDPKRAAALNAIIDHFAEAHAHQVHVVDPSGWLCRGGKPINGLREDGIHYTESGAKKFWAWIMPQLEPYFPKK